MLRVIDVDYIKDYELLVTFRTPLIFIRLMREFSVFL